MMIKDLQELSANRDTQISDAMLKAISNAKKEGSACGWQDKLALQERKQAPQA